MNLAQLKFPVDLQKCSNYMPEFFIVTGVYDTNQALFILQRLNFRSNKLSTVLDAFGSTVSSLQYLDLSLNKFTTVEKESFRFLSNLRTLILSENQISSFPSLALSGLWVSWVVA